jgi:hypothetical protein
LDTKIENITIKDLKDWASSYAEARTFRLVPTNSISKVQQRRPNTIKIYGMFITATAHIIPSENKVSFRLQVRLLFRIAYFAGLLLILGFLVSPDATINGSEPSLSDRLVFVLIGSALWSSWIIILNGLKQDFRNQVENSIQVKR